VSKPGLKISKHGVACLSLVSVVGMFGQQASPSFAAASVKPTSAASAWLPAIKNNTTGRINYENFPLWNLIRDAYGIKNFQLKGSAWLQSGRYDVIATRSPGDSAAETRMMMQTLLQERFHLAAHWEKRETPGYVLLAGKDVSRLHHSMSAQEAAGCQSSGSMSDLAEFLSRVLSRPVENRTGIAGVFNLALAYSRDIEQIGVMQDTVPPPPPPPPPPCPGRSSGATPVPAPSVFVALKEQMGLRLAESREKVIVDVLVVDRVEKVPERN
jgi:uncharacterized protein (TIGR03435 family)